jgi:AcrR family transcriptional regulator
MVSVKTQLPLRAEQAAQTRRRILDGAACVFDEQGFAGARIEDIAARAGVAVPTVYKVFTNKPTLLVGALNQAMAGDGDAAIDQQSWFTEQLDEADPVRQLHLVARNARRLSERVGSLLGVLRSAAPLDTNLARAWDDIAMRRLERSRQTAKNLIAKARGQVRLTPDDAAMTLCALTEPELFATFTANGKTADQYETWLSDILCRSLLER